MIVANVMFDHPAWLTATTNGVTHRVMRSGTSVWSFAGALAEQAQVVDLKPVRGSGGPPEMAVVDPKVLDGPAELVEPLREAGSVMRVANPDLWDALATAIIRQVIRAAHARKLYRIVSRTHGEEIHSEHGPGWLFPAPKAVLALPAAEFARLGLGFKRHSLRAAARAYLERGATWATLHPTELVAELQRIPRIGPWTAGAAVADVTNDFALYPFADLAVRTWVNRLAPNLSWPAREVEFARAWRELAGDQLSAWTLLTLAWGVRNAANDGAPRLQPDQ